MNSLELRNAIHELYQEYEDSDAAFIGVLEAFKYELFLTRTTEDDNE